MKTFQQLRVKLRLTRRRFLVSAIIPFLEFHEKIATLRVIWAQITPIERIELVVRLVFRLFASLPWVIQALIVCVPFLPLTLGLLPPQYRPAEQNEQLLKLIYLIGAGVIVVYYALMLAIIPRIAKRLYPETMQEQQDQDGKTSCQKF